MAESGFMGLVGTVLGIYIFVMVLRAIFKKYSLSLPMEPRQSLKEVFTWTSGDREMIKRFGITLGILIALRFAFLIPLPGVNISMLQDFFRMISKTQGGLGITSMLSNGVFNKLTIFSLGLMPFFSSCILIQFASIFIPGLRKLNFGGESGREKISKYTYALTIIVCILQSLFLSLWLEDPSHFDGMRLVTMHGLSFRLITVVTMTASVVILLFIADIITRYGIGNGIAVIVVSSLSLKILSAGNYFFILIKSSQLSIPPFLLVIVFCASIYFIFNVTNRTKEIELQDQNSKRFSISFRPTIVAEEPLQYAQIIALFPATIASATNSFWLNQLSSIFMKRGIIYTVVYIFMVFVVTYLYAWIVFSPKYIHNLMNKYGYSLVDAGKSSCDYLDDKMSKVLIVTGLFLIGITVVPDLAMQQLKVPYLIASLISGAGVISAVGVFSDIVNQLIFFKNKKDSGIKDWAVCYTAFDEIEAKIKSEFLKSRSIPALVEPLRFTWGMPIRTMVDQYRIYTPVEKQKEARSLII